MIVRATCCSRAVSTMRRAPGVVAGDGWCVRCSEAGNIPAADPRESAIRPRAKVMA